MGFILEDIISKYGFCVHNDGSATYKSVSAPGTAGLEQIAYRIPDEDQVSRASYEVD